MARTSGEVMRKMVTRSGMCELERDQLIIYIRALRAFEKVLFAAGEEPKERIEEMRSDFAAARAVMSDALLDEIES